MTIKYYVERDGWYVQRCRGKRILHLGCVGFTDSSVAVKIEQAGRSLHRKLTDASDCTGIDLDATTVAQLDEAGVFKNILVGDVERLEEFQARFKPFEIVVAGDIIEHLSNPGRMLDGIRPLLGPGGQLFISTPNALGLPGFLRQLRGTFREGQQHVLCFNAMTLAQLLERHGYEVIETLTCHHQFAQANHPRSFKLGTALLRRFPRLGGTLLMAARVRPR